MNNMFFFLMILMIFFLQNVLHAIYIVLFLLYPYDIFEFKKYLLDYLENYISDKIEYASRISNY